MTGLWTNDLDTLTAGIWGYVGGDARALAAHLIDSGAVRVLDPDDTELVERLCEVMHNAYEDAAKSTGWETQQASRKPWADVPEANKATMRVAVRAVIEALRQP